MWLGDETSVVPIAYVLKLVHKPVEGTGLAYLENFGRTVFKSILLFRR